MPKPDELLLETARTLSDAGIPYMVVGAFAAAVHGEPRMTKDIDIVLQVPFEDRDRVTALFRDDIRWEDKVDPIWGRRTMGTDPSEYKIELFYAPKHPLHDREFSRRVFVEFRGQRLPFLSPEDLILRKLVNTKHRRAQDYDDVLMVIAVQDDTLDLDYVREHCGVHRVCGLFERALKDAETIAEGRGQAWEPPEEGWPPGVAEEE